MAATDKIQFFGGRSNTKKIFCSIFFNFNITFLATCGCAFLKDASKIQNDRQKSTPNFFEGSKTLKLNVSNYSNFTITFPTIWRCAGVFFFLLRLKMANTDQFQFFWGRRKLKNLVANYSNFTILFPTIWRCACDFLKVLPKFKMAAMHELYNFLCAPKTQKLKSEIMCRWFYWKLKWPPQVDFLNICVP